MHFSYSAKNIPKSIPSTIVAELLLRVKELQENKHNVYEDMLEVLRVPFDNKIEENVRAMSKKIYTTSLKYIFVVGIGGSSLGSRAIVEALSVEGDYLPIIYLESINTRTLKEVSKIVKKISSSDEFVINLISKAGATTETIANFSILAGMLSHIKGWQSRIVVTTTEESDLAKLAKKEDYEMLYIPKVISGRFSVFTAVGLFPLCIAGYPIKSLLEGAKATAHQIGTPHDSSRRLAEDVLAAINGGAHMIDFFFFNPELESLGKWARQLYAESLGKAISLSGKEVHTGITPTVTIGTEDLHSMLQLYFGGPRDRITLLIPPLVGALHVVPPHPFTDLIKGLDGKNSFEINIAIYEGVSTAFKENKLMHAEAQFSALNAEMLGSFMQWQMQTVASIASALNICTFDQPNIEDYKKITRELLARN